MSARVKEVFPRKNEKLACPHLTAVVFSYPLSFTQRKMIVESFEHTMKPFDLGRDADDGHDLGK
jgi:hypothetical protein